MPEIQIQVKKKEPKLTGEVRQIVADNSDYTIRFTFDELWETGEKTVYFVRSNGYAFAPAKTVDDTVAVPIQSDVGMLSRLYVGVQQGDIKTSQACEIVLLPSIAECIDDKAVQPEPDMWQDMMRRLMELESTGLNPVDKNIFMTQPVGRDENGRLWTAPSGGEGGGGVSFIPGNALELADDGTLNVVTASEVEEDNTLPITAAAVYTEIGNIDVLLGTI